MVAKTAATAPSSTAEVRRHPQRPGASTIAPAPATPQTTPAPATGQESVNPVTHVFGTLAGRHLGAPRVDQAASNRAIGRFSSPRQNRTRKPRWPGRGLTPNTPRRSTATIGVHKTQV